VTGRGEEGRAGRATSAGAALLWKVGGPTAVGVVALILGVSLAVVVVGAIAGAVAGAQARAGAGQAAGCGPAPASVGSEAGLTADSARAMRAVAARWPQITSIGGLRPPDGYNEHSSGRAIDIMIPGWASASGAALGDEIARFFQDNAAGAGTAWIIWRQRIWTAGSPPDAWQPMADRGSPTANHMDHVHLNTYGTVGTGAGLCDQTAAGGGAQPMGPGYHITSCWHDAGREPPHQGIDLAMPGDSTGAAIYAVAAGRVAWSGDAADGYGFSVRIDHPDGWTTLYGHQMEKSPYVEAGGQVTAGQRIGSVGNTGDSQGAHLHLSLLRGGSYSGQADPGPWLAQHGAALVDAGGQTCQTGADGRGRKAAAPPAGDPRQIAAAQAAARGWGSDQTDCLTRLWDGESGWRWDAENPYSGAYGIPQALPPSKMAEAGPDWRTNPATQIAWGLGYIAGRYGTPCQAWSFWQAQSPHWY